MYAIEKRSILKVLAIAVILFMMMSICAAAPVFAEDITNMPVTTGRNVSGSQVFLNETFDVNYSIAPQPIPYDSVNPQQEKEIVLIIDVSGSMEWDVYGNQTNQSSKKRITIAKNAAINFINNIAGDEGVKVSLITYSNTAIVKKGLTTQLEDVKAEINSLVTGGGTNIGDGLRRAYYELEKGSSTADKYLILLTDGEPTYHSVDNKGRFFMNDGAPSTYKGGGSYATPDDVEYCYKVINDLINTRDINSYMIAFSSGSNQNILEGLATSANAQYKAAMTADALNEVYQAISYEIASDLTVASVQFDEAFPEGLQITETPGNFSINGQTVTGTLGNIYYNYNEVTEQYEASPISFSFKVKGVANGDYILGENNSSKLTYQDLNGEAAAEYFEEAEISVISFGKPDFSVKSVTRSGETVTVILSATLPEYADHAEFQDADGNCKIGNITISGDYTISGLSIYATHQLKLWAVSVSDEENESDLKTIFNAIDIN